ncbi:hypothetical protein MUP56_00875 [Patescibacteria group bacterium]|nr:hypothetical protein [Patescibacteria group bacterium]
MVPAAQPQPIVSPVSQQLGQDKFEYWVKVIIGLCILIIAFDLSFIALSNKLFPKKTSESQGPVPKTAVTISGNVDINGFLPKDAMIEIQERLMGDSAFNIAATVSNPTDGASWMWQTAENGTTYELKAVVKSGGKAVVESMILALTAPADSETLRIVSTLAAAPETSPTDQTQTPANQTIISGKVDLNGYIPPSATLTVNAKKQGESNFLPIVSNIKAADGISWSWNAALPGTTYELQAVLLTGSTTIGTSPSLTTAAPAHNEILVINSKATGPVSPDSVSGSFNINGPVPSGASITLSMRKSGTADFSPVLSGIAPQDGLSWNIPNLQTGVSYDILAYLQVNNTTYAQSQLLVVTAPAHNEILTLNIAQRPTAPPSLSITFNCPGKNASNQWQVNVLYNQNNVNPNAQAFILQLGSTSGGSDLFTIQTAPSNPSQMQTYTSNFMLNEGQTYFAQYSYSTCQSCTDVNFYSQFAGPIQVRCVTAPTNTPTMTPTNTPIPTATPIATNTPIPTNTNTPTPSSTNTPSPTPKISQCNESCGGSSGYTCKEGLICFDTNPEAIGGDVCRNPSCTDKTDCTCE